MIRNKILHIIKNNIDITFSILGVLLGFIILYLYTINPIVYLLTLGISLFFASFIYLIFRRKLVCPPTVLVARSRNKIIFITNIIYILSFTASIYILHTNIFRPFIYFILISICSAVLVVEILSYDHIKKFQIYFLLFKIFLISYNLRTGIFLHFGGMVGVDPWEIRIIIEYIIQEGNIFKSLSMDKESIFIIMQIYSVIVYFITGVTSKMAIFISTILTNVFGILFIYLIGIKFLDEKCGLIAALIYGFSDYSIAYSVQTNLWSFGIVIYIIIIYLLIEINPAITTYKPYFLNLFLFIMILTHPVPTTIILLTIFILFFSTEILKPKLINKHAFKISSTFVMLSAIGTLGYWMFMSYINSGNNKENFFDYVVSPLYYSLTQQAALLNRVGDITIQNNKYFFESILDLLGFNLIILLGILGALVWLSKENINLKKISIIFTVAVLFAVPFGFALMGIRNILNFRWFVYIYVLLVILSVQGLDSIIKQIRNLNMKIIFTFLTIFILSFFMITNSMSNTDSPLYLKDSMMRFAFSEQELSLRNELLNAYKGAITVDWPYGRALKRGALTKNVTFYTATTSYEDLQNNTLPKNLVIWRNDYDSRPVPLELSKDTILAVLGKKYNEKLELTYNKLYNNGATIAYLYK